MVLLKTLVLPALTLIAGASASSVLDLDTTNFDSSIFTGTPGLVEFFAPWCGHCKRLAPIYDELGDSFASSKKVHIAKVDGDAHKELSSKYGISGFPTLKWFDGTSKEPTDYTGGRDLDSLQAFITEKTGIKPRKAAQAPSEVEMLTDTTFSGAVGGDKDVFVAFTAPWCGHCKTLAPTWEKLASDFAADKDTVTIAKVDAEANKAIAKEHGVSSYPTIKFFPKHSTTPLDYSGGRDEATLLNYVNEQAGTYRTVGGGLDAKAGTIDALDTIVAKLTGSDLAEISEQVKAAAGKAKNKYAEYYIKVLDKIAANKDYVSKETARLEGMLKKGGLARNKEDDLTSRLNILKKFVADKVQGKDEL